MESLISYEAALETVLSGLPRLPGERVALRNAAGRVLASDMKADIDLPPFDKAAMDGYAVRSCDLAGSSARLALVGEIAAGTVPTVKLEAGEAVRIMTGAPLPEGADAVQQVEKTEVKGSDMVEVFGPVQRGHFVLPRGCEVRAGSTVLRRGAVLWESRIGVLAAFGKTEVDVFGKPSVAIVPTGDELVPIDRDPGPSQIRNSSSEMLAALCRFEAEEIRIEAPLVDHPEATVRLMRDLVEPDVVILTGGVSMGSKDFIHRVLPQAGIEILLHKAAVKPGKPILFGRRGEQLIFGLPGNPVSSFVSFELFVRPAMRKLMGFSNPGLNRCSAVLSKAVRQHPGRQYFKPIRLVRSATGVEFVAEPIETAGSADLCRFAQANALLVIPSTVSRMEAGARVEAVMLGAFFLEGQEDETHAH